MQILDLYFYATETFQMSEYLLSTLVWYVIVMAIVGYVCEWWVCVCGVCVYTNMFSTCKSQGRKEGREEKRMGEILCHQMLEV